MRILALKLSDGSVSIVESPDAVLAPGFVRVQTIVSAVSPGTEGSKITVGQKSLLGKARSRPDQVRQVLDMARTVGIRDTLEKVRSKLEGAQPIGYSSCGRVIEVGEGVEGIRPGDLVACGGGGYANHADDVVVPRNLVVKVPAGVDPAAAAMTTLSAISLQGIRLAAPSLGESVAVIGLGVIGGLACQLAKANGCRVMGIDISTAAVDYALEKGILDVGVRTGTDPLEDMVGEFSRGHGVDSVLICAATASSDPVRTAAEIVRRNGRVVVVGAVGLDLPREPFYLKEARFMVSCSYGPGRYDPSYEEGGLDYPVGFARWTEGRNMEAALDLMASGSFRPTELVTHRIPFDDAPNVYKMIGARSEFFAGVLLDYPSGNSGTDHVEIAPGISQDGGIGFVGAGSYAQAFLLPHFRGRKDVSLTTICTNGGLSAVDAGKRFGFRTAVAEAKQVIADPDTTAIVIATRHDLHGPLVAQALRAGKSVFVEKPLCLNINELKAIAGTIRRSASNDSAPVLQTGFNRRFSPAAKHLKAHFGAHTGPLSMIYRIMAGPIPRDHWIQDPLVGGGRIIGEACHFIDLMQFVCGGLPVEVSAICVRTDDTESVAADDLLINLRFDNGSIGSVAYFASGGRTMPKEELQVFGAGRSGVLDNFGSVMLYGNKGKQRKRCGGKGQSGEIKAFLDSLRGKERAISSISQIATTLATFAAVESLTTGLPVAVDAAEMLRHG
ncbi:MAG: Gfo/Idh/MocA family oxidoreductase [bacterium]|nr:Gfo/Idh/MocA family oxidoreductase [bacterium]